MTTVHTIQNWWAGDDWEIRALLLDENGVPYDLSGGPAIKWSLVDRNGNHVLTEADAAISIIDAEMGTIAIHVPADKTSPLVGGQYNDAIRIVIGGITSTLATGLVYVLADPWVAQEAAPQVDATPRRQRRLIAVK